MQSTSLNRRLLQTAILSAIAWGAISFFFHALSFDVLNETDSKAYLAASRNLDTYPPLELPGYPVIVALFSELLAKVSPQIYMQGISFVAYVLAVVSVYLIFEHYSLILALPGTLLFALFPLEGVTLGVFPRVNSLMYLSVAASLLLYIKGYSWAAIMVMSVSLLTHKSVWPIVLIISIIAVYDRRLKWWAVPLIFMPLAIYWIAGAFHHGDLRWLLDTSVAVKFESRSDIDLPIFSGLVTTFDAGFSGDVTDLIKAVIITAEFILAAFLLFSRIWIPEKWLLGLIVPSLLWPAILNHGELWSAISYTHLIVVPFVFWLDYRKAPWLRSRLLWLSVLGVCAVSQIVWAVYMVRYFS